MSDDEIDIIQKSFRETFEEQPIGKPKSVYSVAELYGRSELTQGQRVKFGNRQEVFFNKILEKLKNINSIKGNHKNLWMNTETNEVIFGGAGKGMKDIDILFIIGNTTYYLECKSNLNLDTEKGPATIEKVKTITECLQNNEDYPNVIGKVLSVFWDKTNVPISGSMVNSGQIMWFEEFNDILKLGYDKQSWENNCKELGKFIK